MAGFDQYPFVSAIIPARNEEKRISGCLDSILANDYPKDRLEVFVVDGASEDSTRSIAERYARQHGLLRVLDNPKRIISAAMNIGIVQARGEIIMKVDAHSRYPREYIGQCVRALLEHEADCVGGVFTISPSTDSAIGWAIAAGLAHPFASGNAYVKIGTPKPRWTDVVGFGCYRRKVFEQVGSYNERLACVEDTDLNNRLRRAGGRILLLPDITIEYFADSSLRRFWRHNFADGVWVSYVLKFGTRVRRWRHWIPLAFVLSLLFSLGISLALPRVWWLFPVIAAAYALANLGATLHLAAKKRRGSHLWALPLVFATRHLAHGLGALYGLGLLLLPGVRWRGRYTAAP